MGGFQHKSVGTSLTQSEYEQTDTAHQFASQATGMMLYSSSSTVNTSLAIGSTNSYLQVVGGVPAWVTSPILADDQLLKIGTDGDSVILNRSSSLGADTELANVLEGTSDFPGLAANSLVISNVTNDGDILFAVSDGGNSIGVLHLKGSDATIAVKGTITSEAAITLNPTTDTIISNGTGLIVGHTGSETVSAGDGSTDMVPEFQILGTAGADSSMLMAAFSTTATIAAAPSLVMVKGGNATIGSHTIVTDDEVLGSIVWGGDDGTDLESIAAWIKAEVDGSPGTVDMPGRIILGTSADGAEVPTTRLTIDSAGVVTVAGALNVGSVAAAGSDVDKFLVLDGSGNVDYRSGADTFSDIKVAASSSATGVVELAIASEVNTGTDTTRAITPDAFAGSNAAIRYVVLSVGDPSTALTAADNKAFFHVPAGMNGMDLVEAHAEVQTAPVGETNGTGILVDVYNATDDNSMLGSGTNEHLSIDGGDTGSDTADEAVVINTSEDDIATNDVIRIDVEQIGSGTAGSGLVVTLGFRLP